MLRTSRPMDRAGPLVMISPELHAEIRRLFYAEHWKIGTIASQLGLHYDTVSRAVGVNRFRPRGLLPRKTKLGPYKEFIEETLKKYPRLRATRLLDMIRVRGYTGEIAQLRRFVRGLRPTITEAFARLHFYLGEQAQADWAHFGEVTVGRARRKLSCFVLVLSYSRAFYLEFFFDQTLESFLAGHVRAFENLGGCARSLLYDNLKSAVTERFGEHARFNPKLLELCAHYHFQPLLCSPGRGNEKGRVERLIRFIREGFFEGRAFTNRTHLNSKALEWRDHVLQRAHPEMKPRTVYDVFLEEKPQLLPLPENPFEVELVKPVRRHHKSMYVRFDLNDYSFPPDAAGKNLTLAATDTRVRILEGDNILVTHPRSYDRGELFEKPEHREALRRLRRKAQGSLAAQRLKAAIPHAERFLHQAFQKGDSPSLVVRKLLLLLDDYGKDELHHAMKLALERGTPRLASVAWLLKKQRTAASRKKPLPLQLHHRPELAELFVPTPSAEVYDELSKSEQEDDEP